jgi:AraC family transcriptional regulator, ethanolamine operon transcriptional activator
MLVTMIDALTSRAQPAPLEGLRWSQLEPGRLRVSRRVVEAGAVTFARQDFNLAMKLETEVPRWKNSVSVIADERTTARWFGTPVEGGDVAISRGTVDMVTTGPSSFYCVTVDPDQLVHEYPAVRNMRALTRNGGDAQLNHDAHHARRLRLYVRTVLDSFEKNPAVAPVALAPSISRSLLPMMALSFEEHVGDDYRRSVTRRIAAVRLCEEYVRQNIDANPTLYDLSRISGLRLRSLINAFQAVTGVSPMAYLKRQRLNGVRQALLAADKNRTRIIDVAANWGFWHMGHFTSDYRAMFGETPSETLHKA